MDCCDYCFKFQLESMKEEIKKELETLIQEQEERIPRLKQRFPTIEFNGFFPINFNSKEGTCYYGKETRNYQTWLARTTRFLNINFPNDRYIEEFEDIGKKPLSSEQQEELLAILKAFLKYSIPIEYIITERKTRKGTNVFISNTNNQSQQQSQQQIIEIFIQLLEDQLSKSQLNEIKQVVEEEGDLEKAKPKVIDKLKSFGENVASNILANIITNPAIWTLLS